MVLADASPQASISNLYSPATGWSKEKLDIAKDYANKIGSSAIVILHNDTLVAEWGNIDKKINSHSVRKSLLSALIGIAIDKGLIDTSETLLSLGISDEDPSINATEKTATIQELLQSRSGVYHPAAYQTDEAVRNRPARNSHLPGDYWYYNNWDFNTLGTIFEKKANLSVGKAFEEWIAKPIGLSDFSADDVVYVYEQESIHPAYPFFISARDLARFGLLFLNDGMWENQEIIKKSWIDESTTAYSDVNLNTTPMVYYGYMWWILDDKSYQARGTGAQYLHIDPVNNIVISHRTDTCKIKKSYRPSDSEMKNLIKLITDAHPDKQ
jgi:CubicO group peptidase (beta-lactamase class C family)